jgi:hypothetical protein
LLPEKKEARSLSYSGLISLKNSHFFKKLKKVDAQRFNFLQLAHDDDDAKNKK